MEPKTRSLPDAQSDAVGAKSLIGLDGGAASDSPDVEQAESDLRQVRRSIAAEAASIEESIEAGDMQGAIAALDALEDRYGTQAPVELIEEKMQASAPDDKALAAILQGRRRPAAADEEMEAVQRHKAILVATAEIEDHIRFARFDEAKAAILELEASYGDEAPIVELRQHLLSADDAGAVEPVTDLGRPSQSSAPLFVGIAAVLAPVNVQEEVQLFGGLEAQHSAKGPLLDVVLPRLEAAEILHRD